MKKFSFFLLPFLLFAQEPLIMILDAIESNSAFVFRYKQTHMLCKPYGVIGMDEILVNKRLNPICKSALEEFFIQNPKLYYFAHYKLYLEQGYHVEVTQNGCKIFVSSPKSYSEMLLENGLAIIDQKVYDEEVDFLFYKALRRAKMQKRGIWQNPKIQSCISEFYRLNR